MLYSQGWKHILIGGKTTPLKNMNVRLDHHPNYWGKKNVPNHLPVLCDHCQEIAETRQMYGFLCPFVSIPHGAHGQRT